MNVLSKVSAKVVGVYIAAITICIGILIWIEKLWEADLKIPFSYDGDSILAGALIKGIVDNGWYLRNPFLGAPYGQYLYDFPLSNSLDFLILRIISFFAPNYAETMNLYFLLTFPLTVITSLLVFRQFKFSYVTSILGSLLFAFIPYHFLRGEGHLFLAAYYVIPLIFLIILWIFTDKSLLFNGRNDWTNLINIKFVISALICILVSSTFIYYPFFGCFFLLVAGATSCISQRNKNPLLTSIILILIIILGVLVNTSPSLIYQYENGKNPEAVVRSPAESEIYGLKIVQLIMPIGGHRIPLLARLSSYYSRYAPLVNENSFASLGFIGSIGFLILIAGAFYRISNGLRANAGNLSKELDALYTLNLSAVLLATIGGFGMIFACLISPEIRCYNRISIFIAFFSLFAIVLFLEEFSRKCIKSKTSRLLFNLIIGLLLVFGVLDQTSNSFVPSYTSTKAEYLNDENFINNIEAIMPENASIFQLPYVPFPEYPPVNNMTDYAHFRAYLHSKDLRWSYGAMKGRPGDDWQRLVASMTVGNMVDTLSQSGFDGIYIDSYGYKDGGAKLMSNITQILGTEPVVSDNQRLYFFDFTRYSKKIRTNPSEKKISIAFDLVSGWQGIENLSGIPTRWMQSDAAIMVISPENCIANLSLQALSFYRNRTLEIYAGDELLTKAAIPSDRFVEIDAPIHLIKGINALGLRVPEGCERPSDKPELNNLDSRCLSVAVHNVTIA